eukprot:COSAG02_NODE_80_length_40128_cov_591.169002_28_plen_67_part_00
MRGDGQGVLLGRLGGCLLPAGVRCGGAVRRHEAWWFTRACPPAAPPGALAGSVARGSLAAAISLSL